MRGSGHLTSNLYAFLTVVLEAKLLTTDDDEVSRGAAASMATKRCSRWCYRCGEALLSIERGCRRRYFVEQSCGGWLGC